MVNTIERVESLQLAQVTFLFHCILFQDCTEVSPSCQRMDCFTGSLNTGDSMFVQLHARLVQNSVVKVSKTFVKIKPTFNNMTELLKKYTVIIMI